MKEIKKRYWAFVGYPESLPENWRDILIQRGLPFAVSPLHCNDLNADGTKKKDHYHIIIEYSGPTTFNNVKNSITDYLGQPIPIPLESPLGMYRYFTHKDNPEKAQYSENDICTYNGFDISTILSSSDIKKIVVSIHKFIRDNDIIEYSDLLDILLDNELYDMHFVASTHTILFNTYLTSKRNKLKEVSRETIA